MPELDSLYRFKAGLWAPYYAIMQQELGATVSLMDFGNQRTAGLVSATTFAGRRFSATGLAPTWTPSEALSAFDTPFNLKLESNWLGLAPILTLNGTDEFATTPDADYWSRVETGAPMSAGIWVYFNSVAASALLGKTDFGANEEWYFNIGERAANTWGFEVKDESAGVVASIHSNASTIVTGQWYFLVATYDSTGGATAATGMELYHNGAIIASPTRAENASYVAMENLAATMRFASATASLRLLSGKVLGGPWSPFYVQAELTAAQVANMYQNMRLGLGV